MENAEWNFRIEIFANITRGQKGEFGTPYPKLALLTARNIREYFYMYTKIRFSTPVTHKHSVYTHMYSHVAWYGLEPRAIETAVFSLKNAWGL